MQYLKYIIHTDGGSRGNPGEAAVGIVIECERQESKQERNNTLESVTAFGKKIGVTTNNVAEYTAVIEALKWMIKMDIETRGEDSIIKKEIQFYLDSTLVVNQLNGLFKVKDANMRMLMFTVRELEQKLAYDIRYAYVPREQNSNADFQVNKALDS